MTNKSISRVSLDELKQARDENFTLSEDTTSSLNQSQTSSYIAKLKDNEIKDFFIPFGFVSMQRQNEQQDGMIPMVKVVCEDFETAFSDYDVFVNFEAFQDEINDNNPFDAISFFEYCNAIETSPEKAMADIIQTELIGQRFHSYQKNYAQRKQKERKTAFEKLPKSLQKHMHIVDEKREYELEGMQNKLMYGTFSGDPKSKI